MTIPARLLILDIDGLRQDVFLNTLKAGDLPNLGKLFASNAVHLNAISTAPSITFCAQTSLFTGLHPNQHGILGNQFFDRFSSPPRFYAFDIGDTLAVKDAVEVFTGNGLLNRTLNPACSTLYEVANRHNLKSLVAYHMLSRGADAWIRPSLLKIAAHTKGHALGFHPQAFDRRMLQDLKKTLTSYPPATFHIITAYFLGVDLYSHHYAPGGQAAYLQKKIDPKIGDLLSLLQNHFDLEDTLVAVVSDHGQIEAPEDDLHSLRLSFPFDREMATLFDALGLDVHDKPGEGPDCEAVVASNGGMAHVYLRQLGAAWNSPPPFAEETLRVAHAFWQANLTGAYSADLQGAFSAILVRRVNEQNGNTNWFAPYQVYTPQGLFPLATLFQLAPDVGDPAGLAALNNLPGMYAGDLLLLANAKRGYYFGAPLKGVHGGLQPGELRSVCSFAWLAADKEQRLARQTILQAAVQSVLTERYPSEGVSAQASITDFMPIIRKVFGW